MVSPPPMHALNEILICSLVQLCYNFWTVASQKSHCVIQANWPALAETHILSPPGGLSFE